MSSWAQSNVLTDLADAPRSPLKVVLYSRPIQAHGMNMPELKELISKQELNVLLRHTLLTQMGQSKLKIQTTPSIRK